MLIAAFYIRSYCFQFDPEDNLQGHQCLYNPDQKNVYSILYDEKFCLGLWVCEGVRRSVLPCQVNQITRSTDIFLFGKQ